MFPHMSLQGLNKAVNILMSKFDVKLLNTQYLHLHLCTLSSSYQATWCKQPLHHTEPESCTETLAGGYSPGVNFFLSTWACDARV